MFRHPIAIDPADIDHMGHVNNATYLKWVQEAVVDYWSSVAPPDAVARHLWVALKHEITYLRPTFLQDTVVAGAWLHEAARDSAGSEARFVAGYVACLFDAEGARLRKQWPSTWKRAERLLD